MSRSIYFTDISTNFKYYYYTSAFLEGIPDESWSLFSVIISGLGFSPTNTENKFWGTKIEMALPLISTGYCTLGGGYPWTISSQPTPPYYKDNFLQVIHIDNDDDISINNTHWVSAGWDISTYNTFTNDIVTHLNRVEGNQDINVLVYYNIRVLDISPAPWGGYIYPYDIYISNFFAYFGNDPEATKVVTL